VGAQLSPKRAADRLVGCPHNINDLSKSVSDKSSPILFVDDTSFIIANRDETEFKL